MSVAGQSRPAAPARRRPGQGRRHLPPPTGRCRRHRPPQGRRRGLRSAAGIIGPGFLALTIAITIHPLLASLQRRRVPGWLAVTLTMLVTYAAVVATAAALVASVARLATLLPSYQAQFTDLVDQATGWLEELGVTHQQLTTAVDQVDLNRLAGVLQQLLVGVAGVVSDLGFILVLLFFLLIDSSTVTYGASSS